MVDIAPEYVWMVVVGFLLAFILCLGIGANDVANTFGTSVGSKVLTLKQACILASIFETAGAIFLGAKVSETVRKGIIDVTLYENSTEEFLLGNLAALGGSSIWLIIATFFKVPVSTTHSIVGATIGFALVANGTTGIDWYGLLKIVVSWFISPVLSGLITIGVFILCDYFILKKKDPLEPGLRWLPFFYGMTILINVFSIFYEGPETFGFDRIPLWGVFVLSFGIGIVVALVVQFFLVPYQRRTIISECTQLLEKDKEQILYGTPDSNTTFSTNASSAPESQVPALSNGVVLKGYNDKGYDNEGFTGDAFTKNEVIEDSANGLPEKNIEKLGPEIPNPKENTDGSANNPEKEEEEEPIEVKDRPETARLFSFLQILTAIFGAFAHGGNDVSNGIGPLISIWLVAVSGDVVTTALTPLWILAFGGAAISIGLWVWGRRVIETLGEDLTTVTPSSGFCIELGAAFTVLLASNVGIPVSSTHCKVGSIVFVGRLRSKDNVDWSLFRNIIFSWVVTVPATMLFSAAFMALFSLSL